MNLLNEAQEQQLKEISKYLLQVREKKGIRIEEVAAKTNIRLYFLQALDEGKFSELPEPVYVQGFIRRYADILGLDGQALAKSFNATTAPVTPEYHQETEHIEKRPNIRIPLFVPFILLIAGAAIALVHVLNPKLITQSFAKQDSAATKPIQTEPSPLTVAPPAATTGSTVTNSQNSTPLPTPSAGNNRNAPVAVTLELQGNSWLQVTADGKTEFIGELTKGDRKTWTAKKQLTIRSGNAGAVLISVNKKPPQILGATGLVKEVTYTPGQ